MSRAHGFRDPDRWKHRCSIGGYPGQFDYAALGHIHKPMKVGSEFIRYCGTPLACSVSEAGQQKGIIMVEMGEKGDVKTTVLPLKPLRQVRVIQGELEEVLRQACQDYVTVILTDRVDLDILDMQDRIRRAFPYLLEIRRENQRKAEYGKKMISEKSWILLNSAVHF